MKKYFTLLLSVCLLLCLTACDDDKSSYSAQLAPNAEDNTNSQIDYNNSDVNNNEDNYYTPDTTTTTTAPATAVIRPFDGIGFTVTGVSPYCQIAVNTANCSEDAQRYVTYSLDKERYANGETAVVTATLADGAEDYTLDSTQFSYAVANQPEYITSLDGLDLTFFNEELDSYMKAKTAQAIGKHTLFDVYTYVGGHTYTSINKIEKSAVYLTSIKKIKVNTDIKYYNSLNYVYTISIADSTNDTYRVYVNVTAYNIIKYADGTLKWGLNDPDSYAFDYKGSKESVDYMVTTCISTQSADYNITKIE